MIKKIHEELINNKLDINKYISNTFSKAKKAQDKLNIFVTLCNQDKAELNDNILSSIPYVLKDNISTKDILTTASSNSLKDYIPVYNATIVNKLIASGTTLIGKTILDELAMGGTGTTGHTGIVKNPWNNNCICGGSSAGSAAAVAAGIVPFAIGSDTGDSVRKPAAFCGIVGYKPTYGLISRYGLFPFASSLDTIGVLTRSVEDAAIVADTIKGIDKNDLTSFDSSNINLTNSLNKNVKGKKLFYIKEICNTSYNKNEKNVKILNDFQNTLTKIKELGIEVVEESIDINLLNALYPTYLCISCAEATSNDSNLTGIVFGPRNNSDNYIDMIKDHRTIGFSSLIKRRFVIGSYVLQKENQEKYYLNACRIRSLIVKTFNKLFEKYDGLIMPCSGGVAPDIKCVSENLKNKAELIENHLVIGNFGGYPSITIPNGFYNNLPTGINITGKIMDDENILNIAANIEDTLGFKEQIATDWSDNND